MLSLSLLPLLLLMQWCDGGGGGTGGPHHCCCMHHVVRREGERAGGQGPLLSTCHCEVNRLGHSVVAIIVTIVIIDTVV